MGDSVNNEKYIELLNEINLLKKEVNLLKGKDEDKDISDELLLSEEENRYVIFPIKYDEIWKMYKKAEANFWTT